MPTFGPAWRKPNKPNPDKSPNSTQKRRARVAGAKLLAPSGWVGLVSDNPPMRLLARLSEDEPEVGDGLGGWDITDRPQQVAMTTWKGNAPYSLSLPILLDGFADDVDIESQIAVLYDVARGRDTEPGSVQISGIPGLPVDDWVITGIDVGDAIRRDTDFKRVRQKLTLAMLEYNPPSWESVKKSALQGAKSRTHFVTVKASPSKKDAKTKGETPTQIARRLHVKWTELRDANKDVIKLTANTPLKIGTKLRAPLPAASSRKARKTSKKKR